MKLVNITPKEVEILEYLSNHSTPIKLFTLCIELKTDISFLRARLDKLIGLDTIKLSPSDQPIDPFVDLSPNSYTIANIDTHLKTVWEDNMYKRVRENTTTYSADTSNILDTIDYKPTKKKKSDVIKKIAPTSKRKK